MVIESVPERGLRVIWREFVDGQTNLLNYFGFNQIKQSFRRADWPGFLSKMSWVRKLLNETSVKVGTGGHARVTPLDWGFVCGNKFFIFFAIL